MISIADYDAAGLTTNALWLEIMAEKLRTAKAFEIHCWSDETAWTEVALRYGEEKKTNWKHGHVVAGAVTPEFAEMLLNQPKPEDTEIYNKMTPFFSIFLDNGFSSEHYGTEMNEGVPWLTETEEAEDNGLSEVTAALGNFLSDMLAQISE